MYQMRYGNDEPNKGRTIKKLRQQGRRDWIEFLEKMLNHPLYKGQQDLRETLTAHRRADGEYVVLMEDDFKSKIVMYRLKALK